MCTNLLDAGPVKLPRLSPHPPSTPLLLCRANFLQSVAPLSVIEAERGGVVIGREERGPNELPEEELQPVIVSVIY